jgi:hypothetical protein
MTFLMRLSGGTGWEVVEVSAVASRADARMRASVVAGMFFIGFEGG